MRPYAFFKNMDGLSGPGFDLGYFQDDMHARAHAIWMLTRNRQCESIDVWDGINEPFTVAPSAPAGGEARSLDLDSLQ